MAGFVNSLRPGDLLRAFVVSMVVLTRALLTMRLARTRLRFGPGLRSRAHFLLRRTLLRLLALLGNRPRLRLYVLLHLRAWLVRVVRLRLRTSLRRRPLLRLRRGS